MDTKDVEPIGQPNAEGEKQTRRERASNWKLWLAAALVVVGVGVLPLRHAKPPPMASNDRVPTVAVAKVLRENLAQEQTFDAEFRPYQEIDLHAKVAGFVQSIGVDIGDQVKQGQLLATLEVPELKEDLERANAEETRDQKEIARAQAAYDDAHISYTRLMQINKSQPNLVAQQDLDTAQAKDSAADAALATAKQQVAVSKAQVDKLTAEKDYCKITAPFSGVITRRYADEGALVQGGVSPSGAALPLVRLSQNDRLRLDFPVSVSYVERVKVGDPVEIRIQATGKKILGQINRIESKVDMDTRTMIAEVNVTNDDYSITPGVYAVAALTLDRREHVLTVPAEAVANPSTPTVMVVDASNELRVQAVKLGLQTPEKYEVVGGLKENELVMIGSRALVKPGQKVEPQLPTETQP